jgi:hypothetical protein
MGLTVKQKMIAKSQKAQETARIPFGFLLKPEEKPKRPKKK